MTKRQWTLAAGAVLVWAGTVLGAPTAQQKCNGARTKAWRTYSSCVEKVLAKDNGGVPFPDEDAAFAKCRHKYFSKWTTLQGAAYTGSTCIGSRFSDNGNGSVTDNLSGLTWEKKTDDGSVHDKDNPYNWGFVDETGGVFINFLNTLNAGGGFAGSNGWRLPTLAELQTIVLDFPCTASSCTCPSSPCVDAALDASTTLSDNYWSSISSQTYTNPSAAWVVLFLNGHMGVLPKGITLYARAVRGGL